MSPAQRFFRVLFRPASHLSWLLRCVQVTRCGTTFAAAPRMSPAVSPVAARCVAACTRASASATGAPASRRTDQGTLSFYVRLLHFPKTLASDDVVYYVQQIMRASVWAAACVRSSLHRAVPPGRHVSRRALSRLCHMYAFRLLLLVPPLLLPHPVSAACRMNAVNVVGTVSCPLTSHVACFVFPVYCACKRRSATVPCGTPADTVHFPLFFLDSDSFSLWSALTRVYL
jgi:hypothetical protein